MDCRVFSFALIFVIGCAPEYQQLPTWQEGESEVGEVCLADGWVCVEFDFTDQYITFENLSGESLYVEVMDYESGILIESTAPWDLGWWTEDIYIESADFEHGDVVEIIVYDLVNWDNFQLGNRFDEVVLQL